MRPRIITDKIILQPISKFWKFIDISGKTFGRLKIIGYVGRSRWYCLCDCGNNVIITSGCLRSGNTKSCGCYHTEQIKKKNTIHGESRSITSEYISYVSARSRCNNKNHKYFKDYGGRGIQFKFKSYQEFLKEVGRKPSENHSLDRIETNGNYEHGNCRWATDTEQVRNARSNVWISIDGINKIQADWAKIFNIKASRITQRRKSKWCSICAVTVPIGGKCIHRM